MRNLFPILQWLPHYRREQFSGDLSASLIVALLLIPQSLAYAQLAELPAIYGIYASIGPVFIYALLGSSMIQSVGPMAITSAMTATALLPFADAGSSRYIALAASLSLLTGLLMMAGGALKLGKLSRVLSIPVIQGFSAGTALLIALGQLGALLSTHWRGDTLPKLLQNFPLALQQLNTYIIALGITALLLLWATGKPLQQALLRLEVHAKLSQALTRIAPVLVMIIAAYAVDAWQIDGIQTLGSLPKAEFQILHASLDFTIIQQLWLPAALIGLAGFLQSFTIAQTLAAERHEKVSADQELIALGGTNIASAFLSGLPVSGGFSRTAVNASAGAQTPLAGVFTAAWMLIALMFLSNWVGYLPQPLLAATIILATSRMIAFSHFKSAWQIDRRDGAAWLATFIAVLLIGPIYGIAIGVALSLLLFLLRSSRPHIAVVGRVLNSEHFRNVLHFDVATEHDILAIRIDESLYFGNCQHVIEQIQRHVQAKTTTKKVLLILSAVNSIDLSAIAALDELRKTLSAQHISLHLAEVKHPVHETLKHSQLLQALNGPVFLSAHEALNTLTSNSEDFSI